MPLVLEVSSRLRSSIREEFALTKLPAIDFEGDFDVYLIQLESSSKSQNNPTVLGSRLFTFETLKGLVDENGSSLRKLPLSKLHLGYVYLSKLATKVTVLIGDAQYRSRVLLSQVEQHGESGRLHDAL